MNAKRTSRTKKTRPGKIVSGGQSGVDRAALDAAIAFGIPHGGWCPRGRLAEDGPIPERYALQETATADYRERTERNVLDSDATLIFHLGRVQGGTLLTRRLARRHGKPCLAIDLAKPDEAESVYRWLRDNRVEVLNVAGPRESQSPGIAARAERFLRTLFDG
jgi:hypothetical protein